MPLLPYLLDSLGAARGQFAKLQQALSLAQLVGGLLSGPLVDRYGPRAVLLLSLWASAASYALTAGATSVAGLYVSRVPSLLQHAILAARAIVAHGAPPEHRARDLGFIGFAYSVGFAVGPAVGGALSRVHLRLTAWAATAGSLVSVAVVFLYLPAVAPSLESASTKGSDERAAPARAPKSSWLQALRVLEHAPVRHLIAVKAFTGLAGALPQSVFSLMLQNQYALSSQANGLVLSYVGLLTMAAQGGAVQPTLRWLGEGRAVLAACGLLFVSYLGMAASPHTVVGLMGSLLPGCVGGALLTTINTAQLTRAAPEHVVGSVLALDMALFAGVRLISPAAGTALLDSGGVTAVGLTAAALIASCLAAIGSGLLRHDAVDDPAARRRSPADVCADKPAWAVGEAPGDPGGPAAAGTAGAAVDAVTSRVRHSKAQ